MLLLRSAALLAAAAVAEGKAAASKPHIITLVIDDLGQPAHRQRESCSVPPVPLVADRARRCSVPLVADRVRRARAGWHDTQVHNPASFMTGTFGALAKAGIVLERQHSYKYCSPTRRSSASTPLLFRQPASALRALGSAARCARSPVRPLPGTHHGDAGARLLELPSTPILNPAQEAEGARRLRGAPAAALRSH